MEDDIDVAKMRQYISNLRREKKALQKRTREAKKEYEEERENIRSAFADLQNRCPHVDTKYRPDPSGNNDSYYICNICGKEAKRL